MNLAEFVSTLTLCFSRTRCLNSSLSCLSSSWRKLFAFSILMPPWSSSSLLPPVPSLATCALGHCSTTYVIIENIKVFIDYCSAYFSSSWTICENILCMKIYPQKKFTLLPWSLETVTIIHNVQPPLLPGSIPSHVCKSSIYIQHRTFTSYQVPIYTLKVRLMYVALTTQLTATESNWESRNWKQLRSTESNWAQLNNCDPNTGKRL